MDVPGRVVTDNEAGGRKTEIKASTIVNGQLMLQGVEKRQGVEHGDQLGGWTVGWLDRRG